MAERGRSANQRQDDEDAKEKERVRVWEEAMERRKKNPPKFSPQSGGRSDTVDKLTTMFRMGLGRITGNKSKEDKKINKR
jgi:nitroimidazol reductase NimA-like FMN-containing flavoprotein (pyridoxamine 5'-phosphate oxidase superfamily)